MCDWYCIELAGLIVQCLIFIGLLVYAWDTHKLQIASQDQNEIMQKPCVVPVVRERSTDDPIGTTVSAAYDVGAGITPEHNAIDFSGTHYAVLQNIGDGAAFNVRYKIQKREPRHEIGSGRFLYIPKGGKVTTHLIAEYFDASDQHESVKLKISYESPSGQRYKITMWTQQVKRQDAETQIVVTKLVLQHDAPPWRVKICRWICGQ